MEIMSRDYYDILGVGRNADPAAITKAYRKLAKKYHPDVNKAADAARKFGEVQQAYDVLKDPQKRKLYDQYGHAGVEAGAGAGGGPGGPQGFNPFGDGSGSFRRSYSGPGGFTFTTDAGDMSELFEQMFGSRGGPFGAGPGRARGGPRAQARTRAGENLRHTITVPFQTAALGGTVGIELSGPSGSQKLDVKIPPGTNHGGKLRLRGKGYPSTSGGPPGDLIVTIKSAAHPVFTRDGLNLQLEVPITLDEAVFGATVEIPTLTGRATLKIPPRTTGGKKLRLRGAGVTNAKGQTGDLLAVVRIDIPEKLTDEQADLLQQLQGKLPNPRENLDGWK